jgi:hypothetical protein
MTTKKEKTTFETLYALDVSDKTEKKGSLTYLSWACAWAEVKKLYPDVNYTVYENVDADNRVLNYFHDGKYCWVKVGVTINEIEHINYLPVMDYRNKSVSLDSLTSFDVNTAIQRCLTKALAMFGLALWIYEGDDLPRVEVVDGLPEAKSNGQKKLSIATDKWNKLKGYARKNKGNKQLVFDQVKSQNIELTPHMITELKKIFA